MKKTMLSATRFNEMAKVLRDSVKISLLTPGANKSFEETQMVQAYTVNCDSFGYAFEEDIPERMFKTFFAATSVYLSKVKEADPKTAAALVLTDIAGEFKFAAIVEYHENENTDEPGNWSYIFTFNQEDLTELEATKTVKKYLYGDSAFKSILDKVAYDIGSIEFQHERYMYECCRILVDTIIQVLDSEAVDNDTVEIELAGYVTFTVSVENDEKIFTATPAGAMKEIIKGDADLEK